LLPKDGTGTPIPMMLGDNSSTAQENKSVRRPSFTSASFAVFSRRHHHYLAAPHPPIGGWHSRVTIRPSETDGGAISLAFSIVVSGRPVDLLHYSTTIVSSC